MRSHVFNCGPPRDEVPTEHGHTLMPSVFVGSGNRKGGSPEAVNDDGDGLE